MKTSVSPSTSRAGRLRLAVTALCAVTTFAWAGPINLVKNGGFEANQGTGQVGANTTIDHWSSVNGYNFLFENGTADTTGAYSPLGGGNLSLWGGQNGGMTPLAASTNGGYMYGADGAYLIEPLSQMIDGMTIGKEYQLNFEWAAAQQYGYTGETTSAWIVYFGNEVQATNVITNASMSASDWANYSMTFTASSSSALLSFLARGTPEGLPPFALLDGVSLVEVGGEDVPEPASWLLFGGAIAAAAMAARRRRPA